MEILLNVLSFAALPVIAATIGAVLATFRQPSAAVRSLLQHFAAGVVFSVVAVELLPDVMKEHNIAATSIGFALGVAAMLLIKRLTGGEAAEAVETGESAEAAAETNKTGETAEKIGTVKIGTISSAMLFAVGVDILVDGFLLGIGFAAGAKEGKLLAFALTIELLSLGLALASTMIGAKWTRARIVSVVGGLSLLIFVGTAVGATVLQRVSAETLEAVLSFGLAALLFLVTEELLTEAHEVPETPVITASFFAGFLLFLILGMLG